MKRARIRVYAELNDFLAPRVRQRELEQPFEGRPSVKDLLEALGIPHTELELILLNGQSVGFEAHVEDGDRIAAYPVFESLDVTPLLAVRPAPLRELRFLLDVHLGKLGRGLRLLGFDAAMGEIPDEALARRAAAERRVLLTRDVGLLKRGAVTHGYFVRERLLQAQLVEIVRRFDLRRQLRPFTRCLVCNSPLSPIDFEEARAHVPPRVSERHREFKRCEGCGRIYWAGTHHARLALRVAEATSPSRG